MNISQRNLRSEKSDDDDDNDDDDNDDDDDDDDDNNNSNNNNNKYMYAFSFGKVTVIYFITIWTVFIFDFPSMNILNTSLNTPAFKYTVVLSQTEKVSGCYFRLFR